ncbi:MAG: adenylate/guanylate cyclase domain-containing protein [Actinomycetota bacterium]
MERLSDKELAERAGVRPAFVRHLAELGILAPDDEGPRFRAADVRRIRLLEACERAGLPLDGIGKAMAEGGLSFAFLDSPQYAWPGYSAKTYQQACDELGLSMDLVRAVHEAIGLAPPVPEDPVREDDLELLPALAISVAAGIPEEALIRTVRVYGEGLRRAAQAEARVYRTYIEEPLLRSGIAMSQMMEAANTFGQQFMAVIDRALLNIYHRQQEHAWIDDMVGRIEETLEDMGVHERLERPPSMCFLDLAGYTRLTEERGDEAAAELAASLARLVQGVSQHHGGLPAKHLGDGVMFFFKDPGEAVVSALEMVELAPAAALPPAHVGLHAGPVVQQDGDYFGRTVNVAARIAGRAGPNEVLVSEDVRQASGAGGIRFHDVGPVELKNVSRPVRLYRASRA